MTQRERNIVCAGCILMALLCITACAKTPEKKIVVDKSKGLIEENIIPEEKDTPKNLQVPAHWQETIEKSDGFVTLTADYEMQLPQIYNTPPFERPYNDLPETLYAPSFLTEQIHIVVTKEGIQRFEWTDIAEIPLLKIQSCYPSKISRRSWRSICSIWKSPKQAEKKKKELHIFTR